jgi:Glycosyltransferase family 28 C-terminal domain
MIAYYVHHQGSGHVHRAAAVAAVARTPVVGLSSRPAPEGWTGEWVDLPGDAEGVGPAADVTAGGVLHWAPRRNPGLRTRMGLISDVIIQARLVVVDVSVEVALLARLHGVPVVVVAQPGDRLDRPHRLAYDLAERLVAPWPERPAPGWPDEWVAKTVHVGALSRFDDRPRPDAPGTGRKVLVAWGAGGLDVAPAQLRAAATATPDWRWEVIGPVPPGGADPANLRWSGWTSRVWPLMGAADVVVTHAGQNALAEVAAARRPAVVIPQHRPHGEQHATTAALARAGIGVPVDSWPAPAEWPAVLTAAASRGGSGWQRWSAGDGAARFAAVLDELAAT